MDKFVNLKSILSNTRSRVVLVFTVLVLVFAIIIGIGLFSHGVEKGEVKVSDAPQISSVVGGFGRPVDPRYAKLLKEQNREQAKQALATDTTAVPTIIDSTPDPSAAPLAPNASSCTSCSAQCSAAAGAALQTTGPAPLGTVCADGTVRDGSGKVIGQTGQVVPGGLVYDSNGNVIGKVGADGIVRDANGNVIGTLSADGTVRDPNGNVMGTTTGSSASSVFGKPVYDSNGKLLGYVGADGKVRDVTGSKVIGSVNSDGQVIDANGNIIGKVDDGSPKPGSPVYDSNGHLLGTVGADGKVRDASGKIIGTVGADGKVRDANGRVIGQAKVGSSSAVRDFGKPVYDSNGKLLGYVGADGKVRNASGQIVGTVGADGSVRDAKGTIVGKVAPSSKANTLAYGKNGQVIGQIGADGKVRDANGNVIGAVGPDGEVRDLNGNVIGTAAPSSTGAAVYDAQGRFVGTVGADGKVRDASGKIVATVGPDGVVRDLSGKPTGARTNYIAPGSLVYGPNGKVLGTIGPDGRLVPATFGAGAVGAAIDSSSQTPQEQAAAKQELAARQQKARQVETQIQSAMQGQLSQLMVSWTPPTQQYAISGAAPDAAAVANGGAAAPSASGDKAAAAALAPPLVKAGTVLLAVIDTAINTDEPGPVMATITSEGKLKGAKLLGKVTAQGQKALIAFNTINLPGANASTSIDTVAIDPDTARTALSSDTDNHYLLRYGTLFASSFLTGYSSALTQSGSTTTTSLYGTTTTTPPLDAKQKAIVALGSVGQQYSQIMGGVFNTPPTVKIYAGTGIGLLFLSDMATPPGFDQLSNSQTS